MSRGLRRSDRGSVLVLVPALVLILVVLGAIALDAAIVFAAQRELQALVGAAANDAAGAGLDARAFYERGEVSVSPAAARRSVDAAVRARASSGFTGLEVDVRTAGDTVRVDARAQVQHLFAAALPGVRTTSVVRAVAEARAERRLP